MNIRFPFQFDSRGQTATTSDERHIKEMLEQLIFTTPGERVNRPDFGSGVRQLIFAGNSLELAATVQFTLQADIQRWLGDLIELQALQVENDDSILRIKVNYIVRRTNQQRLSVIERQL